jgi:hypothetical protein
MTTAKAVAVNTRFGLVERDLTEKEKSEPNLPEGLFVRLQSVGFYGIKDAGFLQGENVYVPAELVRQSILFIR